MMTSPGFQSNRGRDELHLNDSSIFFRLNGVLGLPYRGLQLHAVGFRCLQSMLQEVNRSCARTSANERSREHHGEITGEAKQFASDVSESVPLQERQLYFKEGTYLRGKALSKRFTSCY